MVGQSCNYSQAIPGCLPKVFPFLSFLSLAELGPRVCRGCARIKDQRHPGSFDLDLLVRVITASCASFLVNMLAFFNFS
jgi:hypothetical protein